MHGAVALLVLAMPAAAIMLARRALRSRQGTWRGLSLIILGAVWAFAIYFWIDYSLQQDDVGLIVQGIMAVAVTGSALLATLAFLLAGRP